MRTVAYINRQTLEKTTSLEIARNEWGKNFETVLEDDHESANRGRATRARTEARRAKKN